MSPKQAAKLLERRFEKLAANIEAAEDESLDDMYDEAIELSSGTLSVKEKRDLDYPYAKRHGGARIPGDPAIINVVDDTFRSRWRKIAKLVTGGMYRALINDDPKAQFLVKGTRAMMDRPIEERIIERTQFDRVRRIYQAIRRTFR